jgi:hypothetical protein
MKGRLRRLSLFIIGKHKSKDFTMQIGHETIYDSFRELVIHSENVSWNRFQNLLIINSVLVVAWATLFGSPSAALFSAKIAMSAISLFGMFIGVAWAFLGKRSRQYLDHYKDKLSAIENHHDKASWWDKDIPITDRPFQFQVAPNFFSSSKCLLFWTPLAFSLLNAILLFATWIHC